MTYPQDELVVFLQRVFKILFSRIYFSGFGVLLFFFGFICLLKKVR